MAAAVGDIHRVSGRGGVEVLASQGAALLRLGVVVLEAEHPLPRGGPGGAIADGVSDGGDRTEVAIHPAEVGATGGRRVGVGVDEAGDDRPPLQVDLGRPRAGQAADLLVVADGDEAAVGDGDGGREAGAGRS